MPAMEIAKMFKLGLRVVSNPLWLFETIFRYWTNRGVLPYYSGIFLSYGCNSRCETCDIWKYSLTKNKPDFLTDELTTKEVFSVLEEFKELGVKKLGLWGGDVTLREDLVEIVAKAHSLGMQVCFGYNGMNMTKELAFSLVKAGDSMEIGISVDAPIKEIHNQIRGIDVWDKMIEGANYLNAAKEKLGKDICIVVNCVISKRNYRILDQFPDLKDYFDFSVLSFDQYVGTFFRFKRSNCGKPISLIDNLENTKDLQLNEEEIKYYYENVLPNLITKAKQRGIRLENPMPFGESDEEIKDFVNKGVAQRMYFQRGMYCFVPYIIIIVAGHYVTPCGYATNGDEILVLGDLRRNRLTEIWNSKKYKNFRKNMKPPIYDFCKNCSACRPYGQYNGINSLLMKYHPLGILLYPYIVNK